MHKATTASTTYHHHHITMHHNNHHHIPTMPRKNNSTTASPPKPPTESPPPQPNHHHHHQVQNPASPKPAQPQLLFHNHRLSKQIHDKSTTTQALNHRNTHPSPPKPPKLWPSHHHHIDLDIN
jgi:hypothetical protein